MHIDGYGIALAMAVGWTVAEGLMPTQDRDERLEMLIKKMAVALRCMEEKGGGYAAGQALIDGLARYGVDLSEVN